MDNPEYTEGLINRALNAVPDLCVAWDGDFTTDDERPAFDVYWQDDDTPYWVEDGGGRFYVYTRHDSCRVEIGEARHYDDLAAILSDCVIERETP